MEIAFMKIALVVIAFILLLNHRRGPNAVWGGATLGLIVGFIFSLVQGDWGLLALSFAAGTFIGTVFEWIGRFSKR